MLRPRRSQSPPADFGRNIHGTSGYRLRQRLHGPSSLGQHFASNQQMLRQAWSDHTPFVSAFCTPCTTFERALDGDVLREPLMFASWYRRRAVVDILLAKGISQRFSIQEPGLLFGAEFGSVQLSWGAVTLVANGGK